MRTYLILDSENTILAESKSIEAAKVESKKHKGSKIYWYNG